jgi:hypothetical protein
MLEPRNRIWPWFSEQREAGLRSLELQVIRIARGDVVEYACTVLLEACIVVDLHFEAGMYGRPRHVPTTHSTSQSNLFRTNATKRKTCTELPPLSLSFDKVLTLWKNCTGRRVI